MSYFSTALQRHLERRQITQSDLAGRSGLSKSVLSRLLSGEPHELSDRNLVAILRTVDHATQADLVAARCLDTREAARTPETTGAGLVEISVRSGPAKVGSAVPSASGSIELPQETERAFAWLRAQCPLNPDLEKHLVGYARLTGMK